MIHGVILTMGGIWLFLCPGLCSLTTRTTPPFPTVNAEAFVDSLQRQATRIPFYKPKARDVEKDYSLYKIILE